MRANRQIVLGKLREIVAALPGCRMTESPYYITVDPLEPSAKLHPGDERDDYMLVLTPMNTGYTARRSEPNEVVNALTLRVKRGRQSGKLVRYKVNDDGSFDVEKLRVRLDAMIGAARERFAKNTAELDAADEKRSRRVEFAREARKVLGDPLAFTWNRTAHDLENEYDVTGHYRPVGLDRVSATVAHDGDGLELRALVRKPETLARILLMLRQEDTRQAPEPPR